MKIRLKILAGFVSIALMLVIAGVISMFEFSDMTKRVSRLLKDNHETLESSEKMLEALEMQNRAILHLLNQQWVQGKVILEASDSLFIANYNKAINHTSTDREEKYIKQIEKKYQNFKLLWRIPVNDNSNAYELKIYYQTLYVSYFEVKRSVRDFLYFNNNSMYDNSRKIEDRAKRAVMPGIIAMISALVFVLIFNFFLHFYFVNPIIKITKGVENSAKNNVPFNVEIESNDEIHDLKIAIQNYINIKSKNGNALNKER